MPQFVHGRQQEGSGFTRACLSSSKQITARKYLWNRSCLHRRGRLIAHISHSIEHNLRKAQVSKTRSYLFRSFGFYSLCRQGTFSKIHQLTIRSKHWIQQTLRTTVVCGHKARHNSRTNIQTICNQIFRAERMSLRRTNRHDAQSRARAT